MAFGKNINRYYLKYLGLILFGLVALLAVDYAQLKIPEFYRMLINGMNTGEVEFEGTLRPFDMKFLLSEICYPMCIVAAVMMLGRAAWRIGFYGASNRVDRDLRLRMFNHAKDLPRQYYHGQKIGSLMSLFTNEIETIQECFGEGILRFFDVTVLGGMAFYKMFSMNWKLGLFSLIPMSALFASSLIMGKIMTEKWTKRQEVFSELSDFSQESFSGLSVIKAFVKELKELAEFRKLNKKNENANVAYVRSATLLEVLISLFIELTVAVILGYGGFLVYEKVFNAGELLEFLGYYISVIWPILALSIIVKDTARSRASSKRIDAFLEQEIIVKDAEGIDPAYDPIKKGEIEFRNLSFTFPESDREILKNLSFKIEAGENIAITGRTGSGKSSIVDLLARTYMIPDGKIFIDSVDVNRISIKNVRKHLAYVPQDNFLFSTSIAENIAFAFDDASDWEAVREAARLADVEKDIEEFPDGFDTVLGERGVTVSGGQKQRISIARALMKNAEILILDDSVSAVDTKTECDILKRLRETRKGKTTILIAHRISTIEAMDKVLFMEDGHLLDFGTPHELYDRCEAYRELVELQRLEDEKEGK